MPYLSYGEIIGLLLLGSFSFAGMFKRTGVKVGQLPLPSTKGSVNAQSKRDRKVSRSTTILPNNPNVVLDDTEDT